MKRDKKAKEKKLGVKKTPIKPIDVKDLEQIGGGWGYNAIVSPD